MLDDIMRTVTQNKRRGIRKSFHGLFEIQTKQMTSVSFQTLIEICQRAHAVYKHKQPHLDKKLTSRKNELRTKCK
jgi:hypothetical protein